MVGHTEQTSVRVHPLFRGLLLARRLDERLVNVWQHTTSGNGGTNHAVELLVTSDRKLQVSWRDTLHAQILGRVARQLEHLGGEVLQNGRCVDGGLSTDTHVVLRAVLQVTVDTADGELEWIRESAKEQPDVSQSFVGHRDSMRPDP